jgi:hypothetical protein
MVGEKPCSCVNGLVTNAAVPPVIGRPERVLIGYATLILTRHRTQRRKEDRMARLVTISLLALISFATAAWAVDMPSRKPGLWEISTSFGNGSVPGQVMRQCVDAATDQMMQSRASGQRECSKRDVQRSGDSVTIDSTCTIGGKTLASHAVIVGSFDSAYTMTVTSQSADTPGAGRTMTMAAKWLGPCTADQRPGDMIMANGMKINILDAQKLMAPPGGGPMPTR